MEVCMLLAMWFLWGQGVFRDSVLWACSWLPRRCDSVCVTTCDQSECVICRVIFALGKSLFQSWIWWKFRFLQACVGNFDTIPPWKVVGTYYLDISYVAFKYFDFLSVSDKLELLGHAAWAAMMVWVLFSPFFLDSLLVTVSSFNGFYHYYLSSL